METNEENWLIKGFALMLKLQEKVESVDGTASEQISVQKGQKFSQNRPLWNVSFRRKSFLYFQKLFSAFLHDRKFIHRVWRTAARLKLPFLHDKLGNITTFLRQMCLSEPRWVLDWILLYRFCKLIDKSIRKRLLKSCNNM